MDKTNISLAEKEWLNLLELLIYLKNNNNPRINISIATLYRWIKKGFPRPYRNVNGINKNKVY